jgi:hypothetical protein
MEFHRWSNARAIAEVMAQGYVNLDNEMDLLGFLENYLPNWRAEPQAAE